MTEQIEGKGYLINFNADSSEGFFGDPDGGPETALCLRDMPCAKDGHMWTGNQYFILKGDWMDDYRALVAEGASRWTLKSQIYDEHKKAHGSRWSSDFGDWGKDGILRVNDPDKVQSE